MALQPRTPSGRFAPRRTGFGPTRGLVAWQAAVRGFIDSAERSRTWFTVTVVPYGPFHEFGTRSMRARPHWRVATVRLAGGGRLERAIPGVGMRRTGQRLVRDGGDAKREWELWFGPDGDPAGSVARAYRDEVADVIEERRIIDTGRYHASIAYGRSVPEAAARSQQQIAGFPPLPL